MASAKRERQRARKARAELIAYLRTRIVCERCGLEQPWREPEPGIEIIPCEGALGLVCAGETAVSLCSLLDQEALGKLGLGA